MARIDWNRRRKVHVPWYEKDHERDEAGLAKPARRSKRPIVRVAPSAPLKNLPPVEHDDWFTSMLEITPDHAEQQVTARTPGLSSSDRINAAAIVLSGAKVAIVHTDGGCEPNPGIGGWGVTIDADRNRPLELWGGDRDTTNNRMEMTAAVIALTVLPPTCRTTIITDSQYLQKGMTAWMAGWKRKDFRRKDGLIPNADLWKTLDALASGRAVTWSWVRGHNGHAGNERADGLAGRGMRETRE